MKGDRRDPDPFNALFRKDCEKGTIKFIKSASMCPKRPRNLPVIHQRVAIDTPRAPFHGAFMCNLIHFKKENMNYNVSLNMLIR